MLGLFIALARADRTRHDDMDMTFEKTGKVGRGAASELALGIAGFSFLDLHRAERLADLHRAFLADLAQRDAGLAERWTKHCDGSARLTGPDESTLLIELARRTSEFLARMFGVADEIAERREFLKQRQLVYKVRDRFIKKNVKKVTLAAGESAAAISARAKTLLARLPGIDGIDADDEERFAARVWNLLERD